MITIKGTPSSFTPAFNPIFFYVDSDNKNELGFKYVVDIYKTGTSNLITSNKLSPRPNDGYGVVDIHQFLRSYISEDIAEIVQPRHSPNTYINYDIEFGEEYIFNWQWTDTTFISSGIYSGLTRMFTTSGNTTIFTTGDTIVIQQNAPNESEVYNNVVTTVLSGNPTSIIIDIPYVGTTPVGGQAQFSNRRKTLFPDLTGYTGYTAFNGAVAHQDFMDYSSNTYNMMVNLDARFLTNIPQRYTVRPDNTMRLDFYSSLMSGSSNTSFLVTTEFGLYQISNATTEGPIGVYGCGPADITNNESGYTAEFGSFPVFKNICYDITVVNTAGANLILFGADGTNSPWEDAFIDEYVIFQGDNGQVAQGFIQDADVNKLIIGFPSSGITATSGKVYQRTTWYNIQFFSGNTASSTGMTFNVNWTPAFQLGPNVELVFLDRMGSYAPVNFELQNFRTQNVSRDSYNQILGNLNAIDDSGKWQYNSTDRGITSINTRIVTQLDLNTNWITEDEAKYIKELYSSQRVYIKEYGKLWPVNVITNSTLIPTKYNKKLIQLAISITYANNDIINAIQ